MLDSETKRRIDTARNILVGKVPDPKSQVEQITIALIYKFMNDMDAEAEEMGGKRKYFVGEYKKYGWANLISPALSGFEVVTLYGEAIEKMTHNDDIPKLFRDIFKNAYLPYRDPETLKLFLKTINEFNYDHSEKLGDAFEYLLSVLGSQGDAGQFRTPRHIIDFMVKVIDPQKDETILDPACGTAGFLISAYKHILASNSKDGKTGAGLKPAERKKLAQNIRGYDISPDMVRLSLVNLYLHGFATPEILEYDSLTSEERWNETADVILANPPFMSPKGGIKPHKRFSVQSNRSEVLFVDYMAEHLSMKGRAAIIVPEGIIFQSAGAYKQLRQYLVEQNYLWAVVSLPAGVFNPYAGVKTSILLLDKALAQKTDQILFVKIEKDGYDLGAQRRALCNQMDDKPELCPKHSDLPDALNTLQAWQKHVIARGDSPEAISASFHPTIDSALLTPSSKLAENDYNLSADRYREVLRVGKQKFPMVSLEEIATLEYGFTASAEEVGDARFIRITDISENGTLIKDSAKYVSVNKDNKDYLLEEGDLLVARTGATYGKTLYFEGNEKAIYASYLIRIRFPKDKVLPRYYWSFSRTEKYWEQARKLMTGGGQPQFNGNALKHITFPLPPLEVQRQIVDEIAAHQQIIDGARQVVEGWKPDIELELQETLLDGMDVWENVELGEVCAFIRGPFGGSLKKEIFVDEGYLVYEQYHAINNDFDYGRYFIDEDKFQEMKRFEVFAGDVLVSCSGTMGKVAIVPSNNKKGIINQALLKLTPVTEKIDTIFLKYLLEGDEIQNKYFRNQPGVAIQNVASVSTLKTVPIPLPPLEIQREIVARIESERAVVEGNRRLIQLYEGKVKKVIQRVWEG
jgi:type I restriction enzyme M protein